MAALTNDLVRATRDRKSMKMRATDAVQFFAGSLVGVLTTTGLAVKWADTLNFKFLGVAKDGVTGDTASNEPPEVSIDTKGELLEDISVTGVSDITKQGALVFATSDNDFTLTVGTNVKAVGVLIRHKAGAVGDVLLFTPTEHQAL